MWIVAPSSAPADKVAMSRETHHDLIKAVLPQHNQPRSEPPPLWQSGLAVQGVWPINATSRTGLMRLFRAQPKRKSPFDPPFQILKTNHQFLDRARS
jgi:hypothetical protein